jgi:hypothetical protein
MKTERGHALFPLGQELGPESILEKVVTKLGWVVAEGPKKPK